LTLVMALPIAAGLMGFGDSIAGLMYGWGRMAGTATDAIGSAIEQLSAGLPALALITLTQAVLNAKGDTVSPLIANLIGLVALVGAGLLARAGGGLSAITWGWAAANWVILACHIIALHRRHDIRIIPLLTSRTMVVALAVTLGLVALGKGLVLVLHLTTWMELAVMTAAVCAAGLAAALLLRVFAAEPQKASPRGAES
jgi:peptidoglycan biosynthesis protein MviN/MurJ (putative lipid II flippase)